MLGERLKVTSLCAIKNIKTSYSKIFKLLWTKESRLHLTMKIDHH